jgi:hypothetical protein
MHYLLGIVVLVMFLVLPQSPRGLVFVVSVALATLVVKIGAKFLTKSGFSLASCAKAAIYLSALVAVSIAFCGGSSILSRPLGKLLALHWRAGDSSDCQMCPDRLFIVICDADAGRHIQSLRELASLRAEYAKDRQMWQSGKNNDYSCISNDSFRLRRHSGSYGSPYDEADPSFRQDVSFQVVQESADEQIVEVRYSDSMKDIVDSLFRYQVKDGKVNALESKVVPRILIGLYGVLSIVASVMLLYAGIRAFLRLRIQK